MIMSSTSHVLLEKNKGLWFICIFYYSAWLKQYKEMKTSLIWILCDWVQQSESLKATTWIKWSQREAGGDENSQDVFTSCFITKIIVSLLVENPHLHSVSNPSFAIVRTKLFEEESKLFYEIIVCASWCFVYKT